MALDVITADNAGVAGSGRVERVVAWAALGWIVAASAVVLALRATRPSGLVVDNYNPGGVFTVAVIGFAVVGALVVHRQPGNRMGWLFLIFSFSAAPGDLGFEYGVRALDPETGPLPLGRESAWVYGWTQAVAAAPFAAVLLWFPTGHPPTRRWHVFSPLLLGGPLLSLPLAVALWDDRGPRLLHVGDDPDGLGIASALSQLQYLMLIVAISGGAAATIRRLVRGGSEERQRVKWLVAAGGIVLAAILVDLGPVFVGGESPKSTDLAIAVAVLAIPVASGIGILRHRLFDIDLVVRRSLLYGAVSAAIGGTYLAAAGVAGVAAGDRVPLAVAVGITIVALAIGQPIRHRLQRAAARRILGERLSRYEVVARMGDALEHAGDLEQLAPRIATAVRDAIQASWVRISFVTAEATPPVIGESGIPVGHAALTVPLHHREHHLGAIECGPRRDGAFAEDDVELVQTLSRQAALGAQTTRLAGELAARIEEIEAQARALRESRRRVVRAQDEERRRIERNIHDGVQQEVVAVLAKLRLARNQLARGADTAEGTLAEVQTDAARLLDELRELGRGIHPSVLVDSGLVAAIESKAARLPVGVVIEADPRLRSQRFASALEAAAYFVVAEALTNVAKHADATSACVQLSAALGRLEVEIRDDGVGFAPSTVPGSGLTGLRDRVEALGGELHVHTAPGKGTRVTATLPLDPPADE